MAVTEQVRRLGARMRPRYGRGQYAVYLLGCLLFSFGANFFIASNLGTDPLDVFALGLLAHLPITIGIAQGGFAAACLAVWAVWNRRAPLISPFVTFFFCGSLIDLWMHFRVAFGFGLAPYGMLLCGVTLCVLGSGYIIMSGIGIRAMDLVAITMVHKWRAPFWIAKGTLELVLLATGWVLGGPVGPGTVAFLVCVGWLIAPVMWVNERCLRLANHGLRPPDPQPVPGLRAAA